MKYNLRKFALLFSIIFIAAVIASGFTPGEGDRRNLKVLPADISSDSLERIMDDFVTSL